MREDHVERRKELRDAMARLAQGDEGALSIVYRMTSAKLYGIVIRIVQDVPRAEQILQDIYLKVWRKADLYDPSMGSPISWLAVVARNAAIDEVRRQPGDRLTGSELDLLVDDAPNADAILCDEEDLQKLRDCLDSLGDDQRRSIRMAYFGGLTHSQLSARLDIPLGTLKSRIRRGLHSLKGCLGHG